MEITVLNGSPKGNISVTMQYVQFIQKKFPEHELKIINISQKIKKIEKNETAFNEIIEQIRSSDGIIWAFPVYTFLVPSQYKRFIELIWERRVEDAFQGKYTAAFSTSARVFDHTAHHYINAICDDLEMKYVDFYSAESNDLLKEAERDRLLLFAELFFEAIQQAISTFKNYHPLEHRSFEYVPGKISKKVDLGGKKVLIITDSAAKDTNLGRMILQVKETFSGEAEAINLYDLDIKGGCQGCIHCWYDNQCIYQDKYMEFFNQKVKTVDIVIIAGTINDRFLSAKHREFMDRIFFNHHKQPMKGQQLGSLISGPIGQLPYMPEFFQGQSEYTSANGAGMVTDEYGDSAHIDAQIQALAERLVSLAQKGYIRPPTFLGVGAMKITRDLTYGTTRFVFQDDYRYLKENGLYDFPQKDYKARAFNMMMVGLTKFPGFRKEMNKRLKKEMITKHEKIVASA